MRAAPCSLLLLASTLATQLAAQVVVTPNAPKPPAVERIRVQVQDAPGLAPRAGLPDSIREADIKVLTDSIKLVAQEIAAASVHGADPGRLGYLQGRLGSLEGRLGALNGELAAMEGRLGAMQGRFGALQGRFGRFQAQTGDLPGGVSVHIRQPLSPRSFAELVKRVNHDPQGVQLPPQDSIARGGLAVAAGSTTGRVAALGPLDVFGTVNGDAVALDGDVVVHKGGRISGDAVSVGGTVRLDGGTVDGEMRSIDRAITPSAVSVASSSGFLSMLDELQTAMGSLVVMVLLGFAAMVFAEERLRVVAGAIEARFGRALFAGILTEVSFIPGIVLAAVLLVITLVGIVLLPVAIPGIFVLGALLAVLGFLAVSRVAGQALTRRAATVSVRGAELRSMLAGLFFFFGLWLVAALLSWVPVLGSLLHALAFVVTWAAATVGLGAAVITRGGGRPTSAPVAAPHEEAELGWQTPTPISGIAAARRQATNTPEV